MDYEPLRYTKVPWSWLDETLDLRRGALPTTRIRCGAAVHILGWIVESEHEILALKILNGEPYSLATTSAIAIDTDDNVQSNPNRVSDYGEE